MTRRRLVLAFIVVAALGAASWLLSDGLPAEERRLVGTWRLESPAAAGSGVWTLGEDGVCRGERAGPPSQSGHWTLPLDGRWLIRDRVLAVDPEPSLFRRALRRLGPFAGPAAGHAEYTLDWLGRDRVVLTPPGGAREEWVRAPLGG